MTTINTKKVQGRRELSFQNCQEILADVERLAATPDLQRLGNWTLGQTLYHLEAAMRVSLDGGKTKAPWFMRVIGKLLRNRIQKQRMPAGFKLPPEAHQELIADADVPLADALAAFRTAVERLQREPQRHPHPVFGAFTAEEWERVHCRHAELHLSFFQL